MLVAPDHVRVTPLADDLSLTTTEPIPAMQSRLHIGRDLFHQVTLVDIDISTAETQPLPVIRRRERRSHLPMLGYAALFQGTGLLILLLRGDSQWIAAGELAGIACVFVWLVDLLLLCLFRGRA